MHTTPTLDFIVVLSGQLEVGLENGTQRLGPGDVLVQRGTAHSWRNPGFEPCTFVVILIDAARA
jgi:quercetin dioxygenase-like cupin family protein